MADPANGTHNPPCWNEMQPQNPQHRCPGSYKQLAELDRPIGTYFPSNPGILKGKGKCYTLKILTTNKSSGHLLFIYTSPWSEHFACINSHFPPSQQSYEVNTIISPIFHMRNLRHRWLKLLTQVSQGVRDKDRIWIQTVWVQNAHK